MSTGKYRAMLRQIGPWAFARLALRKLFCAFYRVRFKRCGSFLATGSFDITGHRYIEVGRLTAGDRFRLDAIHAYFDGTVYSPSVTIGDSVSFGTDVHLACNHRLVIGNHVLGGSHIYITDHDHGIYAGSAAHSRPDQPPVARALTSGGTVVIGDNVFIGEHVCILKNVTIGDGAVIAAGAVVTNDVPAGTIVAGNPARVIKRYNTTRGAWLTET